MTAPDDALAALEARAAAAVGAITADLNDRSGCGIDGLDDDIRAEIVATWRAAVAREITAALRTLAAQHAGDVAAAVAGERERAVAVCRAVADGWERASVTAKVDTGLALIRAEGATECADAIAAPTGGGE